METTPQQRIWRGRVEALIALAAPALDLMLNVGERVSRIVSPEDRDYYPIRPSEEAFQIQTALRGDSPPRPLGPVD